MFEKPILMTAARDRGLDRGRGEVDWRAVFQCAAEGADRGAGGADDVGITGCALGFALQKGLDKGYGRARA